jgi:hypothetical protein
MASRFSKAGRFQRCGGLNAHRLVVETAQDMAQEYFEIYARDNNVYRKLRAEGRVTEKDARAFFVLRVAPKLYEDARQSLAALLTLDDETLSPALKEKIYEALCLDNDLRAKRFVATEQATIPSALH